MKPGSNAQRGFTLPQLVVVGLMVGLLAAVAVLFARPKDYGAQQRDAQRWLAVALQMQVLERFVAGGGSLPAEITDKPQLIGSEPGMVDLCLDIGRQYDDRLLYDPALANEHMDCKKEGELYATGLIVSKSADNKVTIGALAAEANQTISLTKQF